MKFLFEWFCGVLLILLEIILFPMLYPRAKYRAFAEFKGEVEKIEKKFNEEMLQ